MTGEVAQQEIEELRRALEEQTRTMDALRDRAESASAQESRLVELLTEAHREILHRDEVIEELGGHAGLGIGDARNLLQEQRAWAARSAADVVERDATIRQLQAALVEQTEFAQRLAAEVAHRDAIIHNLKASSRVSGAIVTQATLMARVLPAKVRLLTRAIPLRWPPVRS